MHYQLWDSVDRFLIHITALLKSDPLQFPRPQRLLPTLLTMLGCLPLSDQHPNAAVSLGDVAAIVTSFATRRLRPVDAPQMSSVVADGESVRTPEPAPTGGGGGGGGAGAGGVWLGLLRPLLLEAFSSRRHERHGIHARDAWLDAPHAPLNYILFEELLACVAAEDGLLVDLGDHDLPAEAAGKSVQAGEVDVGGILHQGTALDLLREVVVASLARGRGEEGSDGVGLRMCGRRGGGDAEKVRVVSDGGVGVVGIDGGKDGGDDNEESPAVVMLQMTRRAVWRLLLDGGRAAPDAVGMRWIGAARHCMQTASLILSAAGLEGLDLAEGLGQSGVGWMGSGAVHLCMRASDALTSGGSLDKDVLGGGGGGGVGEDSGTVERSGGGGAGGCAGVVVGVSRCCALLSLVGCFHLHDGAPGMSDAEVNALRHALSALVRTMGHVCTAFLLTSHGSTGPAAAHAAGSGGKEVERGCGEEYASEILGSGLQLLLHLLCRSIGGEEARRTALQPACHFTCDPLLALVLAQHLKGAAVKVRQTVAQELWPSVKEAVAAWMEAARHRAMPGCIAVYIRHIVVILEIDPLAVQMHTRVHMGVERPPPTMPAPSLPPPPPALWENTVQEFHETGSRCLVLSKRTAGQMAKAAGGGDALLPMDERSIRMLLECPTLRVAAPLWAHVNVCRTCSALILAHLEAGWHGDVRVEEGGAAHRKGAGGGGQSPHSGRCLGVSAGAGGNGEGGGGRVFNDGGGVMCVSQASRELTILGQMAVSRRLVSAVWVCVCVCVCVCVYVCVWV